MPIISKRPCLANMGLTLREYRLQKGQESVRNTHAAHANDMMAKFAENPNITHDLDAFRQTEESPLQTTRIRCKIVASTLDD